MHYFPSQEQGRTGLHMGCTVSLRVSTLEVMQSFVSRLAAVNWDLFHLTHSWSVCRHARDASDV